MTDPIPEGFEPCPSAGNYTALVGPPYQKRGADGNLVFGLLIDDRHLNARGVVHGGLLMTFMDQLLARSIHDRLDVGATATVQLDNQFLSGVRPGEWVDGRATIGRATRSLVFVTGRLAVGDRPVLTSSGVWKILGA